MSDVARRFLQTLNDRGASDVSAYLDSLGAMAGNEPEAGRITVNPGDPPVHRLVLASNVGLAVINVRYHDNARSGWDIEANLYDWESVRGVVLGCFLRSSHGTGFPAWSLTIQNPALDIRGHADDDTRALGAAILRHRGGIARASAEAPGEVDARAEGETAAEGETQGSG